MKLLGINELQENDLLGGAGFAISLAQVSKPWQVVFGADPSLCNHPTPLVP